MPHRLIGDIDVAAARSASPGGAPARIADAHEETGTKGLSV